MRIKRINLVAAAACLSVLAATSVPASAQVADSVAEFSGVQGQNNWNYGFYDRTTDPGGIYDALTDFQMMTQFDGTTWFVQNGTFWTSLNAQGAHPNGTTTTGGRQPVEQWAIRRYASEVSGTINLSGTLITPGALNGGNGTTARIFVGGVEVFTQNVNASSANYSFNVNVSAGSFVDFALDPRASNDIADTTTFTAVVNTVSVTAAPEPGTLALLAMAALPMGAVVVRRRKKA